MADESNRKPVPPLQGAIPPWTPSLTYEPPLRIPPVTVDPYGWPIGPVIDATIDYEPRKSATHRPQSGVTVTVHPVLSDAEEAKAKLIIESGKFAWRLAKEIFSK